MKVDEPSTGKRVNPQRSKHSETEQRRRSKINERQALKKRRRKNSFCWVNCLCVGFEWKFDVILYYLAIYARLKKLCFWARFQVLRDLIPQNDQKRDKASFLLEVPHSTFNHLFLVFILMVNCIFVWTKLSNFPPFIYICRSLSIFSSYRKNYKFMNRLMKDGIRSPRN